MLHESLYSAAQVRELDRIVIVVFSIMGLFLAVTGFFD